MATLQDLLRRTTDYYDKIHPAGQFALSFIPGVNAITGMGQMDKYATQGDVGGMGITALGAMFPPVKAAGAVGRGLLRHLSPTGVVANVADSAIELPKDKQAEWDLMREEQLRKEAEQRVKDEEFRRQQSTYGSVMGVRG